MLNKKPLDGIKEADFSGLLHSLTTYGDIHDLASYREALRAAQHLKSFGIRVPDLSDKKIRASGDSAVIRWSFFDVYGNLERPNKQDVDIKVNGVLSRAAVGSVDRSVSLLTGSLTSKLRIQSDPSRSSTESKLLPPTRSQLRKLLSESLKELKDSKSSATRREIPSPALKTTTSTFRSSWIAMLTLSMLLSTCNTLRSQNMTESTREFL